MRKSLRLAAAVLVAAIPCCVGAAKAAAEDNPGNEAVKLYDESIQLWCQRKFAAAAWKLFEAHKKDPSNERIFTRLCNTAAGANNPDQYRPGGEMQNFLKAMQRHFTDRRRSEPNDANVNYAATRMQFLKGDARRSGFEKLSQRFPENMLARDFYARTYIDFGKPPNIPRARAILREGLSKNPSWATGWRRLGDTYGGYIDKSFIDGKKSQPCHQLAFLMGDDPHCYNRDGGDLDENMCLSRMAWYLNTYNEGCPLSCSSWLISVFGGASKSLFEKDYPELGEAYYKELVELLAVINRYAFCSGGLASSSKFLEPFRTARDSYYAKHPDKAHLKNAPLAELQN